MDLGSLWLVLVPLFVLVDPFASVGLFLALTTKHTRKQRLVIAAKACAFAAVVLIVFAAAGGPVLEYLGIELYALEAAGGLLLLMIGLNMLREGRDMPRGELTDEIDEELEVPTGGTYRPGATGPEDPSIVPLGLPMLAGPGAIALVIVQASSGGGLALTGVSILLAMFGAMLILMAAARMHGVLGENGSRVITRIMGMIVVAFACQYVFDGITGWLDTRA